MGFMTPLAMRMGACLTVFELSWRNESSPTFTVTYTSACVTGGILPARTTKILFGVQLSVVGNASCMVIFWTCIDVLRRKTAQK